LLIEVFHLLGIVVGSLDVGSIFHDISPLLDFE
jgi:hypothetical protein